MRKAGIVRTGKRQTKSTRMVVIYKTIAGQRVPIRKSGQGFQNFFSDVSLGQRDKSPIAYRSNYDLGSAADFDRDYRSHTGNFDEHIRRSIPTFGEVQARKGAALVRQYGRQGGHLLDVGGSEGSWAKALTQQTGGRFRTTVLDPNPTMAKFFRTHSNVPGADYNEAAFHQGWTNENGSVVPTFKSKQPYDVVHNSMAFQFMGPNRADHYDEAKRFMKPGGLFLTEEKLWTPEWERHEAIKDAYKNRYFDTDTLAAKDQTVGFAGQKGGGMTANQVSVGDAEKMLRDRWRHVAQYWDSGNFKGYAASDDPRVLHAYLRHLGDTGSAPYAEMRGPRVLARKAVVDQEDVPSWDHGVVSMEAVLGQRFHVFENAKDATVEDRRNFTNSVLRGLYGRDRRRPGDAARVLAGQMGLPTRGLYSAPGAYVEDGQMTNNPSFHVVVPVDRRHADGPLSDDLRPLVRRYAGAMARILDQDAVGYTKLYPGAPQSDGHARAFLLSPSVMDPHPAGGRQPRYGKGDPVPRGLTQHETEGLARHLGDYAVVGHPRGAILLHWGDDDHAALRHVTEAIHSVWPGDQHLTLHHSGAADSDLVAPEGEEVGYDRNQTPDGQSPELLRGVDLHHETVRRIQADWGRARPDWQPGAGLRKAVAVQKGLWSDGVICRSCAARNPYGATYCRDCNEQLPGMRAAASALLRITRSPGRPLRGEAAARKYDKNVLLRPGTDPQESPEELLRPASGQINITMPQHMLRGSQAPQQSEIQPLPVQQEPERNNIVGRR